MLIEAGYDLLEVAKPLLWGLPDSGRTLLVVEMYADLGYRGTSVVTREFDGDLDAVHEVILTVVDSDLVRYIALVQECPDADPSHVDHAMTRRFEQRAEREHLRLVGHLYVTPDSWCSTGPMHRFAEYPWEAVRLPTITVTPPVEELPPRRRRRGARAAHAVRRPARTPATRRPHLELVPDDTAVT